MPINTLGKYELLGLLATGGMGEIFLARQRGPAGFSKLLVVKRILRHLASDPDFVRLFLNEAKLAGLLMHPNIVQIYELGHESDDYYIAMEYVRGHNLRSVFRALRERGEAVDPGLSAQIAIQALEGLHYAHTLADGGGAPLQIVHRDVSPDNILVSAQGGVKLVDFGIAKAFSSATNEHTEIKGKFAYMAPEQLNGERVDRRADIYSVGCILYECLAGAPRFAGGSAGVQVAAVLKGEAPALLDLRPELTPKLVGIVDRAVCLDREQRFGSAREMAQALEETLVDAGRVVGPSAIGDWLTRAMGSPVPDALLRAEATASDGGEVGGAVPGLGTKALGGPGGAALGLGTKVLDGPGGAVPALGTKVLEGPSAATVDGAGSAANPLVQRTLSAPGRRLWTWWAAAGAAAALLAVAWIAARGRSSDVPEVHQERRAPVPVAAPASTSADAAEPSQAAPSPEPLLAGSADAGRPLPAVALAPAAEPAGEALPASAGAGASTPAEAPVAPAVAPTVAPRPAVVRAPAAPRQRKGRITVLSQPWAFVTWNQQELGVTPLTKPVELPAGRQVLILRNPEMQLEKRVIVEVPAGGTAEVKVRLDGP